MGEYADCSVRWCFKRKTASTILIDLAIVEVHRSLFCLLDENDTVLRTNGIANVWISIFRFTSFQIWSSFLSCPVHVPTGEHVVSLFGRIASYFDLSSFTFDVFVTAEMRRKQLSTLFIDDNEKTLDASLTHFTTFNGSLSGEIDFELSAHK